MGLFCQMLHIFERDQSEVVNALTKILKIRGFSLTSIKPIDKIIFESQIDTSEAPAYIIGPKLDRWTPVIDIYSEPYPAEICAELSEACKTYVLCIMVHDDDVMFYNLDFDSTPQDGYISNPQYFEQDRISEEDVESQRHTPEPFDPLLPKGRTLTELLEILNAGWWNAHDSGRLDADGVMNDEDYDACAYQSEDERMTAFGNLLGLSGQSDYPFTDWRENEKINWQDFKLLQFA